MMYSTLASFAADFDFETEATLKVLRQLTDESLAQPVKPGSRTLGDLAWHIIETLEELPRHAGLEVPVPEKPSARTAAGLTGAYSAAAEDFKTALQTQWTDARLQDNFAMYGETWSGSTVLSALLFHQCHHRGQMTVLMRQAGLRVPGIYGPAAEEWDAMGLAAHP